MHREPAERRSGTERRDRTLRAYWHGSLQPRRRSGRRASDATYPIIDWHSPRVFALVVGILLLCAADGTLTVMLLADGAVEINPVMAWFVPHSLGWFAAVKLALTATGVAVLVACSRMKLFRAVSGEALLGLVLAGYATLVAYELVLLDQVH